MTIITSDFTQFHRKNIFIFMSYGNPISLISQKIANSVTNVNPPIFVVHSVDTRLNNRTPTCRFA